VFHREVYVRLPFFTSLHRYMPAMFQTYGQEVAYVPVNDRARVAGTSKYSNLVRAIVGLYDLVGVSWLRRRTRVPVVTEDTSQVASQDNGAAQTHVRTATDTATNNETDMAQPIIHPSQTV